MRCSSVVVHWTRPLGFFGWNFVKVTFFVSCILRIVVSHYTKNCYVSVVYFPEVNQKSLYGLTVSRANVEHTSDVRLLVMLILPIVGNWKLRFWDRRHWNIAHTIFHPNPSSSSDVELFGQTNEEMWSVLYAFISRTSCKECVKVTQLHGIVSGGVDTWLKLRGCVSNIVFYYREPNYVCYK